MLPDDDQCFAIHDVIDFPIVRWETRGLPSGFAPQWQAEMDALIDYGRPFALVALGGPNDEAHEDRRLRSLWLKKNKARLAALCKVMVVVEPDALKRAALDIQTALAAKAFGVAMRTAASVAQADALARGELDLVGAAS